MLVTRAKEISIKRAFKNTLDQRVRRRSTEREIESTRPTLSGGIERGLDLTGKEIHLS
jgi:hypothetical protein